MLADILRTDGHRFRALEPQSDELRALRALVRTRDDLVAERVALANQLRSLLESFWPGAAEIFADVDSLIALAFIGRYPTPQSRPSGREAPCQLPCPAWLLRAPVGPRLAPATAQRRRRA